MTQYLGTDKNIQRKVRRAYQVLQEIDPEFQFIGEGKLITIFKAVFIALDEDYKDLSSLAIDESTNSLLRPVPFDTQV